MRLESSFPAELEKAKAEKWPLIVPVGTIEYHGPHCAFGCDTLIVNGLLERLEAERNVVICPPVWYGVSGYAVGGPEKNTVSVDIDAFEANIYGMLKSFLRGGWKNIYLVIHHQYENEIPLPMTLACMKAGKKLTMEYLEESKGTGWWASNDNAAFYDELGDAENPWNWITVLPAMSKYAQHETGYDHAGEYECSILMALYPDAVDLSRIETSNEWFIKSAKNASLELGNKMVDASMKSLRERIR